MANITTDPKVSHYRRRRPVRRPPSVGAKSSTAAIAEAPSFNADDVERAIKVLAGLTLSLYVLGLLSINGYLFHLGTSDFSLARPRFVYTGALIIFFLALSYLAPVYSIRRWRLYKPMLIAKPGSPSLMSRLNYIGKQILRWWELLIGFLFPLSVYFVFFLLFTPFEEYLSWTGVKPTITIAVAGLIVTFAVSIIWRGLTKPHIFEGTYRLYHIILWYLNLVLVVSIYVAVFMALIFPIVPEQFGGGQPKKVRLVLKQETIKGASEVGILGASTEQITKPTELIYEGSDKYVLRSSDGRVVTVDKQAVLFVETGA